MADKTVQAEIELKKGFAKLQAKVLEADQNVKIADAQIDTLKRDKALAELTKKEISKLDAKTPTYEAIGRLFIYRDINTIVSQLNSRIAGKNEKIEKLENSKEIYLRSVKELENDTRELVQQWKNK